MVGATIKHTEFENTEAGRKRLHRLIQQKKIVLGGNYNLKIYGTLHCNSGKRMLRKNRVFFQSEAEAIANGFRPCGHCMMNNYLLWKNKMKK